MNILVTFVAMKKHVFQGLKYKQNPLEIEKSRFFFSSPHQVANGSLLINILTFML
jgi:hypothetical protein